jgi:hypothetical protein
VNCSRCGTRVKVIESRTKDGLKRREWCPTCRFESLVLVPYAIDPNYSQHKSPVRRLSGNKPIEDIRGNATTWVQGCVKRLNEASNLKLDEFARDLRNTWPKASGSYETRRRDDEWNNDDQYRARLLNAIKLMANDRIVSFESKRATVASPEASQERQKKEASEPDRPQRPLVNDGVTDNKSAGIALETKKPTTVKSGQYWALDSDEEHKEKFKGLYRVLVAIEDNGELLAELVRLGDCFRCTFTCRNMLTNPNWRHVERGCAEKPATIKPGQLWEFDKVHRLEVIETDLSADRASLKWESRTGGGHGGSCIMSIMLSSSLWAFRGFKNATS